MYMHKLTTVHNCDHWSRPRDLHGLDQTPSDCIHICISIYIYLYIYMYDIYISIYTCIPAYKYVYMLTFVYRQWRSCKTTQRLRWCGSKIGWLKNTMLLLLVAIEVCEQHTATHCNTLQHTATQHSATLCHILPHNYTLILPLPVAIEVRKQYGATRGNTRKHTETHCNALQHTDAFTSGGYRVSRTAPCNTRKHTETRCITLQHTAAQCNTLHHTAARCSIPMLPPALAVE